MHPTPYSKYRSLLRVCVAAMSGSLVFPLVHVAHAADGTWNTTTTGLLWSTPGNWSGSTVADGSGFTANFNALNLTAGTTVHVDTTRTIGNLVFGDTDATSAGSWTLSNNGNAANVLTLSGTMPTITVNTLNSNSLVTISAVIAGTSGLTKNGTGSTTTGILTLSGANTYSGGTTISTGSLRAQNSSALGTGAVTVASGARLQVNGGINLANTVNLNGSSALYGNNGANTLSGTVNVQANSGVSLNGANDNNITFTGGVNLGTNTLTVTTVGNTNAFVTFNGTISGTGGITKSGAGTLTINNDQRSTYSGTTTLSLGNLAIGHDGALGTGTFVFGASDNPVAIRSTGTESRSIANAVSLAGNAGTNAIYNFGSSNSAFNGNLAFTNTGDISLGAFNRKFSVLNTTRFDGGFTGAGRTLTLQTGGGTLVLNGANTYTGVTTISAGTLQLGNGGTTGSLSTSSAITNNSKLAINRGNRVVQGVDFAGLITGTGSFTQAGSGTTVLGNNSYTGATIVDAGTLLVDGALSGSSAVSVNSGGRIGGSGSVGSVTFNTGAALAYDLASAAQGGDGLTVASFTGAGLSSFTIFLTGDATGFDAEQDYQWTVLTSAGSITLGSIALDTSGFGPDFDGQFNVSSDANSIYLNYVAAAIPEPSSYALLAGGALLGLALVRRRR